MSDQTDKIILDVDVSALTKGVEEATAKLVVMKNQMAILDNAMKSGTISVEDYARKSAALKAEIQSTSQQQSAQARILTQYVNHSKAAAGSVDQLKAELAILTSQYNALSQEERENSEVGKKLAAQTLAVNEALKGAGAEVGDFRRNVGNYTGSILQAVDGTGLLATVTENLEGAQKAYNATLTVMKASIAGNVSMLKIFKLAMAATGIGAVVLLLGGLVSFLTRSQKGIDMMSRATAGLGTIMGVLTDKLSGVGEMLVNAFNNPKKALTDLVDFMQTNLLNRIKAVAVIFEGLQKRDFGKINDGIIQMATGITDAEAKTKAFVKELANAAAAGASIEKENQRIRDSERALNVERAKSKAEIERLKFISEDANKSEAERIKAAQQAYALEKASLDKALQLQNDRIKNIEREQALTNNLSADNDKLAEERIKLAELEEESFGRQTELNNKLNDLRKQSAEKRAADEEAAMARRLERQKLEIQLEIERAQEGSAERVNAELKMLAWERDQKLQEYKKGTAGYELAQVQYQNAALKLAQDHAQNLIEVERARIEEFKKLTEQEHNEQTRNTQDYFTQRNTELNNLLADGAITQEKFTAEQMRTEMDELQAQLQNAKDYGQSTIDIENAIAAKRVEVKKFQVEEDMKLEDARYQFVSTSLGALQNLISLAGSKSKEAADFAKALTIFQIGIDMARSISQIITLATAPSADNILSGGLAVPIKIAGLTAAVLGNFAQVKKMLTEEAPAPGFYDGGFTTKGNPREQATNLGQKPYTYHKSEYVAPHDVIEDPAGAFYVNQLEGLRLKKRGFYDGGYTPSLKTFLRENNISTKPAPVYPMMSQRPAPTAEQIAAAISRLPAPIVTVKDINSGQKRVQVKQTKTDI